MVLWIRSRLSLRFWMADSLISLAILRDTAKMVAPNIEKISIMEKSREKPRCVFWLFGLSFIDNPPFICSAEAPGRKEDMPICFIKRIHLFPYYTISAR